MINASNLSTEMFKVSLPKLQILSSGSEKSVYSTLWRIPATPTGTEGQQCPEPQGSVTGLLLKYVQSVNSLEPNRPTGSH